MNNSLTKLLAGQINNQLGKRNSGNPSNLGPWKRALTEAVSTSPQLINSASAAGDNPSFDFMGIKVDLPMILGLIPEDQIPGTLDIFDDLIARARAIHARDNVCNQPSEPLTSE